MQRRVKRSLLLFTFLVVAVVLTPLTASAQSAPTVTITPGPEGFLLDATLVRVPVEITCAPMEVEFNQGSAELRQAVSKDAIAVGRGFEDSRIVCDGTPHTNSYSLWAEPSGPPFEKGDATVDISAFLCDPSFSCQSGGSGIQVIRLRKA